VNGPARAGTTVDYAAVRELRIEGTVPTTVRETVDAVSALKKGEVSLGELAAKLQLDKNAASRQLRDATDRGYLVNPSTCPPTAPLISPDSPLEGDGFEPSVPLARMCDSRGGEGAACRSGCQKRGAIIL
jgi:hypothetical protein